MNPQTLPTKAELERMKHDASEMLEDALDMLAVIKSMQEIQDNPEEDQWISWDDLKKEINV